jgi:ribonuclease P protein component
MAKGLKSAVVRNRLKRQLRAALFSDELPFGCGADLVVAVHPRTLPVGTEELRQEIAQLCQRADPRCQPSR